MELQTICETPGLWQLVKGLPFQIRGACGVVLQSLCLTHTGKPAGVAVSHCITWSQTQLILSLRVRSATTVMCGIIVALDGSEPSSREVVSSTVK